MSGYLANAFNIMDVRLRNENTLRIISQFPYVNCGLFSKHIQISRMGFKARRIIIECGGLDWRNINPDIFGSMIQAVVNLGVRANLGVLYTSVPNIMKVIKLLFLDDMLTEYQRLRDMFEEKRHRRDGGMLSAGQFLDAAKPICKNCRKLLLRTSNMKFFDPACGSENFLIITYKNLRLIEMDTLRIMR